MNTKLLSRDAFREAVFARDNHTCVFCPKTAVDAHHIIERRLFPDSGYYVDNGASVCAEHHIQCETTELSVEDVRSACGITNIIVPPHLYRDQVYDKWGNPIQPNGQRLRGELFYDDSIQKILKQGKKLDLFTNLVKYPRTYHLPWSSGISSDDRILCSIEQFKNKRVIVTTKMDGENTTCYNNYIHARSVDSRNHSSRNWVKHLWSQFSGDIPEGWRICGENLYAKHSIKYNELQSYFYGFSIWNDKNNCLSWEETLEWFTLLNITPVPIIYDDIFNENKIKKLWDSKQKESCEGYVLRIADEFSYSNFRNSVGKFVRENHIRTVKHWMHGQPIEKNELGSYK